MLFEIKNNPETKLGTHNGIYTKSYQEARALYDSKIRKWKITFSDYLFCVENTEGVSEQVFIKDDIQNCSCKNFIESQCGTCLHIEAVKSIPEIRSITSSIEIDIPIVYVSQSFQTKIRGKPSPKDSPKFFTPSVNPFIESVRGKNIPEYNIQTKSYDVFKEFDINLFDFQLSSVEIMIKTKRNVLTLKMGLGKTLCALACCKLLESKEKIIVIAPNNLKYQWQREINRFGLGSSLVVVKGTDLKLYSGQRFLIVSYEMLNHHNDLFEREFDIAIIDEIQKIKNPESVTWSTISKLKTEFIFALSGTPIQNSLMDLVSIVKIINPYEMLPEWKFYDEYCDCSKAKMYGIKRHKAVEIRSKFNKYIINPVIDTSKFSLPKRNDMRVHVNLTPDQIMYHDNFMNSAQPLMAKSAEYPLTFAEKAILNGLLTKARLASVDARLMRGYLDGSVSKSERMRKIEELIQSLVLKGEKVVVYSEWIRSLSLLTDFLETQGIVYAFFHGDIPAKKRDTNLVRFISDPKVKVLLSTDSGGVGIDGLQFVSRNIIHVEPLWNPMRLEQRNGRLVRALQKSKEVDVYYFNSEYGVEKLINEANDRKRTLITDVLGLSITLS